MTNDIMSAETAKQLFDVIMICNVVGYSNSDYKRVLIENFERIIRHHDNQLRTSSDALADALRFYAPNQGQEVESWKFRMHRDNGEHAKQALAAYEATKAKGGV